MHGCVLHTLSKTIGNWPYTTLSADRQTLHTSFCGGQGGYRECCPSSDKYIITCGRKFSLSMAHRSKPAQHIAESEKKNEEQGQEEEEYVLLDFGSDFSQSTFPPNTPYTLSGLDTLNPILTIGDGLKLRGEYEETIGSCLIFSESAEEYSIAHEETGPSDANLFAGKCIVDPNQAPRKQIKNVCQLHKVLKFKVVSDETTDKNKNDDNINQGQ